MLSTNLWTWSGPRILASILRTLGSDCASRILDTSIWGVRVREADNHRRGLPDVVLSRSRGLLGAELVDEYPSYQLSSGGSVQDERRRSRRTLGLDAGSQSVPYICLAGVGALEARTNCTVSDAVVDDDP